VAEIAEYPHSFLRIDKPAAMLPVTVGEYDPEVYAKAKELMELDVASNVFIPDFDQENELINASDPDLPAKVSNDDFYYIYRLIQGNHTQTGIVACVSVADYNNQIVKRHENTREHKLLDRVKHIEAVGAHTGPVLLTYKASASIDQVVQDVVQSSSPIFNFTAPDGVQHQVWRVSKEQDAVQLQAGFAALDSLYIADGHHRAAAASVIAEQTKTDDSSGCPLSSLQVPGASNISSTSYASQTSHIDQSDYFLAAIYPDNQMQVLEYNRVIANLGGRTATELLQIIGQEFDLSKVGPEPYKPEQRGSFGMYLDGNWYKLKVKAGERPKDPVDDLDIAILHSNIIAPILGVTDPTSNPDIAYIGGARGLLELETRADATKGIAFSLYPCSLAELFVVADAGHLMPPKSTWFDPKPRSGLFIHKL
jgi:uncharacterized protein (DUF1015 family)